MRVGRWPDHWQEVSIWSRADQQCIWIAQLAGRRVGLEWKASPPIRGAHGERAMALGDELQRHGVEFKDRDGWKLGNDVGSHVEGF